MSMSANLHRYVLLICLLNSACSLDASLEDFRSTNRLHLNFDDSNKAVSSSNYRSYSVMGSCAHVGQEVQVQLGSYTGNTTCLSDKTFVISMDLDGITDGDYALVARQDETDAKKTSEDTETVTVDLTPPVVSVDPLDNRQNYSLSSLKADYPVGGDCSEPFHVVKVSTSLSQEYLAVCSASQKWQIKLDLSSETASSIDFYIQHFDAAGNISTTATANIAYPRWQKISPDITATGVPSVRIITQYGDSGRILMASPLRNDDLVDVGIVNFNNTGLTRINPLSGQWGIDTAKFLAAVPKHGRALYVRSTIGRAQLRELHSVKIDGTDDKVLMGPTPANPVGGVTNYTLAPNQDIVVALGDIESTDNEFNLYAINVLSGAQVKLNGALVNGGDVRDFLITPNGEEVIFRADKDTDEGVDLYAVKLDGTNLRKISPTMAAGKSVYAGYRISADSKWVTYRENQTYLSGSNTALSVVSLVSGEITNISATGTQGFVEIGAFSPNSKYLAYRIDRPFAGCYSLLVLNLETKAETQASPACSSNTNDLLSYAWSQDSLKLGFGMITNANYYDLFVANLDGSNSRQITTVAATRNGVNGGYKEDSIVFTPDNTRVVFIADLSGVAYASTNDMRFDLYSAKVDGSEPPVKLTTNSVATFAHDYPVIKISPNSDRVVFVSDLLVDARNEMFLAAVDGSSIRKISPAISIATGGVMFANQNYFIDWTRNLAVFQADTITDNVYGVYLASLSLSSPSLTSITMPQIISGDVPAPIAAANGSKIIFRQNPTLDAEMHIYAADADGSNVLRMTKNFPSGAGTLRSFSVTADGAKVVYIADQDTTGKEELYISDTSIASTPLKLNAAITASGGNITQYKVIESANKIVYMGDLTTDSVMDIYVVNFDGTGNTKLTPAYSHTTTINQWDVTADGSAIVVRWDYRVATKIEVDMIPLTGGAPIALNAAIGGAFDINGFSISKDSAWVCYWGYLTVARRNDVRLVNVATPATNYLVDVGIDTARMPTDCNFTPDSSYAIIKGDWATDGKTALKTFNISTQTLYPINASLDATANTSWSETLTEGSNKRLITLSESAPEVYEIYSSNFDGTDARKISKTPYAGGQVNANTLQAVRILDDTDRTIIYSGLIDTLGKWDLYAVKWDGTLQRKLVTLPSYADIYDFYVYTGSSRVFFRADAEKDGMLTLYSVNADGTALKNHMPGLSGNTGVWYTPVISTSHVFFLSDAYQNQLLELFVDSL